MPSRRRAWQPKRYDPNIRNYRHAQIELADLKLPRAIESYAHRANSISEQETKLLNKVSRYLNPAERIAAKEQVSTYDDIYTFIKHDKPTFYDSDIRRLDKALQDVKPGYRIVIAPLLTMNGLQVLIEKARVLPNVTLGSHSASLRLPTVQPIGQLLHHPDSVVTVNADSPSGYSDCIKYKIYGSHVASRTEYISSLLLEDRTTIADGVNKIWTANIMDILPKPQSNSNSLSEMYESINPALTIESLVMLNLLHRMNNTPGYGGSIEFANAAIYREENASKVTTLTHGIGIDTNPADDVIYLSNWPLANPHSNYTVRGVLDLNPIN